jgi:hypothetical protein
MEGDVERGLGPDLTWQAIYFQGTEKLRSILREFQLDSWDAMKMDVSMPLGEMLSGPRAGRQ